MAYRASDVPNRPLSPGPVRLNSLTGLRFFASLAVVLVHVSGNFLADSPITTITQYGYVGVSFFFLLSGYVLTWSYSSQSAPRFWWMRFSRIWPLQMALMFVWFAAVVGREPAPLKQAALLLMAQAWAPHRAIYFAGNYVSWSLSCEMFFYLMFPLVIRGVLVLGRRGVAVLALVTTAALLAAPLLAMGHISDDYFFWLFYIFPPYRFGEFLLGMLLARAVKLGLRVANPALGFGTAAAGLAALVMAVTGFTAATGANAVRPFVSLGMLPFFMTLMVSCTSVELGASKGVLTHKWLIRLGEWSFALYLVHVPLLLLTQDWGWWENVDGMYGPAELVLFLVLAIAASAFLHHGLEKPVERQLRRLFRRPALSS